MRKSLQERSIERGCIDFNSKEAKIILNKNGKPVDVQLKSRGFAEQMIERMHDFSQCMCG